VSIRFVWFRTLEDIGFTGLWCSMDQNVEFYVEEGLGEMSIFI
jgi:hypothetical protein